nr:unnamed protein product [Meloidogyne enterolobii]CAD2164758.1 unnamed protein product [Meloidogyne enterolobii]
MNGRHEIETNGVAHRMENHTAYVTSKEFSIAYVKQFKSPSEAGVSVPNTASFFR